jgi:hypothetical protein
MFDSLADRIKQDEGPPAHKGEQIIRWAVVLAVSLVLFGGLYLVVQHLEG